MKQGDYFYHRIARFGYNEKKNLPKINEAKKFYNVKYENYSIMIFHPVTTDKNENKKNLEIINKLVNINKDQILFVLIQITIQVQLVSKII